MKVCRGLRLPARKLGKQKMNELVTIEKNGDRMEIDPSTLEGHRAAGWNEVGCSAVAVAEPVAEPVAEAEEAASPEVKTDDAEAARKED